MNMPRLKSIPELPTSVGWKDVPIKECHEDLSLINDIAPGKIAVSPKYFEQRLPKAIQDMYARKGVVAKLVEAANLLPKGYKLVIWDAWRPLEVQQRLFDSYREKLCCANPDKSEEEIQSLTQTYVSLPSSIPTRPSPHFTGGAIDLTISDGFGSPLDMGTGFDYFGVEAAATFYEGLEPDGIGCAKNIRNNRRLLYSVMTGVGFSPYDEEWWHYDFGNQFHARRTGAPHAIYGLVDLGF